VGYGVLRFGGLQRLACRAVSASPELLVCLSDSIVRIYDRTHAAVLCVQLRVCDCGVCRKPEAGVRYLVAGQFVDDRPSSVARFLLTRKGLSKQMIGDYLGNLQRSFNMEVLG